jgi:hypothetical protein
MARVPTQTFLPSSDSAMARPPGSPLAHSSTLKPGGTCSLSSFIWSGGVAVNLPACGASFDSVMFSGMPCFHIGGAAGFWAWPPDE